LVQAAILDRGSDQKMNSSVLLVIGAALIIAGVIVYGGAGGAEGFATAAAPLSAPSPNLAQAYQFRLGKREMVDAVVQNAK
jgi:hypothetical protein